MRTSYWASEHDYSMAVSVRDGGLIARKELAYRHSPDNPQFSNLEACPENGFGVKSAEGLKLPRTPELATPTERTGILEPPLCVHDPFIRLKVRIVSRLVSVRGLTRVGLGTESDGGGRGESCAEVQEGMQSGKQVFEVWDDSVTIQWSCTTQYSQ